MTAWEGGKWEDEYLDRRDTRRVMARGNRHGLRRRERWQLQAALNFTVHC